MSPVDKGHIHSLLTMAEQSLMEARCLGEHEHILGTINRIYYASFYAVSALLEVNNLASSKHSGIRGMFNKNFVHPGVITPEQGIFYNQIYKMRHASDYMTGITYGAGVVEEFLSDAHKFVADIKTLTLDSLEKSSEE